MNKPTKIGCNEGISSQMALSHNQRPQSGDKILLITI